MEISIKEIQNGPRKKTKIGIRFRRKMVVVFFVIELSIFKMAAISQLAMKGSGASSYYTC